MIDKISALTSGAAPVGRMTPVMTPGFGVAKIPGGADFSALVQNATSGALNTLRVGETVTQSAVMGKAGTQEMVEAVMSMETSLRTTLAIRDKCVEAYQEIMRMPV